MEEKSGSVSIGSSTVLAILNILAGFLLPIMASSVRAFGAFGTKPRPLSRKLKDALQGAVVSVRPYPNAVATKLVEDSLKSNENVLEEIAARMQRSTGWFGICVVLFGAVMLGLELIVVDNDQYSGVVQVVVRRLVLMGLVVHWLLAVMQTIIFASGLYLRGHLKTVANLMTNVGRLGASESPSMFKANTDLLFFLPEILGLEFVSMEVGGERVGASLAAESRRNLHLEHVTGDYASSILGRSLSTAVVGLSLLPIQPHVADEQGMAVNILAGTVVTQLAGYLLGFQLLFSNLVVLRALWNLRLAVEAMICLICDKSTWNKTQEDRAASSVDIHRSIIRRGLAEGGFERIQLYTNGLPGATNSHPGQVGGLASQQPQVHVQLQCDASVDNVVDFAYEVLWKMTKDAGIPPDRVPVSEIKKRVAQAAESVIDAVDSSTATDWEELVGLYPGYLERAQEELMGTMRNAVGLIARDYYVCCKASILLVGDALLAPSPILLVGDPLLAPSPQNTTPLARIMKALKGKPSKKYLDMCFCTPPEGTELLKEELLEECLLHFVATPSLQVFGLTYHVLRNDDLQATPGLLELCKIALLTELQKLEDVLCFTTAM